MKFAALEEFAQQIDHFSCNDPQVLDKYVMYAKGCADPLNVYKYMEEKSICTFLPRFWIEKAEYFVQVGDFKNGFECLDEARSREEIVQDQVKQCEASIKSKKSAFKKQLVEEMKRFPAKGKRSNQEYDLIHNNETNSHEDESYIINQILQIYEQKYGRLKKQKEERFQLKNSNKQKSWLFKIYEKELQEEKKIEEIIAENSMKNSCQSKYYSIHTPIRPKDPQRLTKTMDSVEILKKKRTTRNKSKSFNKQENESYQNEQQGQNSNIMTYSIPVGKMYSSLRRRVTFETKGKIEKIRSDSIDKPEQLLTDKTRSNRTNRSSIKKTSSFPIQKSE